MPSRRTLLATAGAVGATGLAGCSAFSAPDAVDTRAGSTDWPLVNHDSRHTNRNPHATPPRSAPSVRWTTRLHAPDAGAFGGYDFAPVPAIVDGRVYVGGEQLTSRRIADGAVRWSVSAGGPYHGVGVDGEGDGLFVVTGESHPYRLVALGRDGEQRWTRTHESGYVASAPLVAGGTIYLATQGDVVAYGADRGRLRWSLRTGLLTGLPAVDRDVWYSRADNVYGVAPRPIGRNVVTRFHGRPPSVLWETELGGDLWEPPAVGQERIAVATNRGIGADSTEAGLHVLSKAGEVKWSRTVVGRATSPVIGDGVVFQRYGTNPREVVGDGYESTHFDARVVAHDAADGAVRWEQTAADLGDWRIEPVLTDRTLYVPLHDDRNDRSLVRAYDVDSGTERWTEPLDSPAVHLAAVGDALLVTTHGGRLLVWE